MLIPNYGINNLIVSPPGQWLMEILNMLYGLGFSNAAVSYINFRWGGAIIHI